MNKQFKQISLMAGGSHYPSINPDLQQKFGELIVQECVGIIDDLVSRNADATWTSNELYTDYNGALFLAKRRIEEHFGVEE